MLNLSAIQCKWSQLPPISPLHSQWATRRAAEILCELLESHVSDMLVVLEVVQAGELLAANRNIIECQVQDLRISRSPKYIRLSQDARCSNLDILKENAGKITRSALALTWIRIGFQALHGNHKML